MGYISEYGPYIDLQSHNLSLEAQKSLEISIPRDALESGSFSNLVGPHTRERRFAVTERGYMGMVPPYSETGDAVCIIPGTQVPFLLRQRVGGNYAETSSRDNWLVGESYFHGMM